ncbi:hypothetical protein, partial [Burkholderia ubonensis]|uniref:hypothetical protein n=1 Tax=Burkholderia ubonensis TaxID=101571 RepID=UPI001E331E2B
QAAGDRDDDNTGQRDAPAATVLFHVDTAKMNRASATRAANRALRWSKTGTAGRIGAGMRCDAARMKRIGRT